MRRPAVRGGVELEHSYWRSYVHVGVVSYLLGGVAVLGYALGAGGAHRVALVALDVASMAATITVFWWIGLRLVDTPWRTPFFATWTLSTYLFVGVGIGLDGGTRSPLSYLLVMPLLFAGLAYSRRTVVTLTAVGVVVAVVVGATTDRGSAAATALLATAMAVAGVLTSAMARSRARLTGALVEAANHDSLTGCMTRRAFYERLHHEARRAQRYGTPFTLVLADLDNLKALNDHGGHEAGDEALRALSDALRTASRGTDLVGRLGGDEFAVILPES
ncbi:MAG TPA: GGDEF domain-containing protein, partial [Acidimicrobiales bacterium]|nr:GGDEF domain-containing protein [Acidimicrobiales bacterium]